MSPGNLPKLPAKQCYLIHKRMNDLHGVSWAKPPTICQGSESPVSGVKSHTISPRGLDPPRLTVGGPPRVRKPGELATHMLVLRH